MFEIFSTNKIKPLLEGGFRSESRGSKVLQAFVLTGF
jgi:hypothetical protein